MIYLPLNDRRGEENSLLGLLMYNLKNYGDAAKERRDSGMIQGFDLQMVLAKHTLKPRILNLQELSQ